MIFQPIASGSSGNLYLVKDGDRQLAIECGMQFKKIQQQLKYRLTKLDGVLVSHCHSDHARSLRKILGAGVDVYALDYTFESLELIGRHNAHTVKAMKAFTVKEYWRVLPFDLIHDVPALGFLIESDGDKLLYVTDTAYVKNRFQGLTMIAIEANYSEPILRESDESAERKMRSLRYHMSIEWVLGFLAANDLSSVREIHLLHLSDAHSDEAMFKRVVEEATGKPVYVAKR